MPDTSEWPNKACMRDRWKYDFSCMSRDWDCSIKCPAIDTTGGLVINGRKTTGRIRSEASPMKRAKTARRRCANPLFEKWLKEWRDEARAKGSSVESHFAQAIESLRKYPLPLATGKDCILLQHFGVKLCAMLDKRLKKHLESKREAHNSDTERGDNCDDVENDILPKKSRSLEGSAFAETAEPIKRSNFVPKKKSGFTEKGREDERARKSRENAVAEESADSGAHLSPVRAESEAKAKGNRIQRRSRVHSLSSSDPDEPSHAPIVESTGRIDDESSERTLGQVASGNNRTKEKGKVTRKVQPKKRVRENDAAGSEPLAKTVEDADNGVKDQFHMAPGTFDVVMLVDTHETSGAKTKSRDDPTISELERLNTPFEVRHLKIGDFAWVARCRDTKKELVLPYTVERKRMDDLASSIKDGRFHEQKFRLRQSGIPNVIYMVESYRNNEHLGLPLSTLLQAATNSQIQDGFVVKYTDNHKHSMQYLSILTNLIHKIFKDKHLTSISKADLGPHCIISPEVSLMEFKQFNKAASKMKTFKVREMFIRHLLQLKGISVEKALAIVERYPTPALLIEAFQSAGEGGEKLLAGIKVGNLKRQLGPTLSKTVFELYTKRLLD